MIVDGHAHLISDDHEKYVPAPLSGALRPGDLDDPMTAERLLREMDAAGVERAVLVQRGHVYGFDSSYVCDSADRYPDRFAAVCSVDADKFDSADQVRRWVGERGAAGIRMMEPFKGAGTDWFASDNARQAWLAAAELKASICVHVFRWARTEVLPVLAGLLKDIPETTPVVVDHFAAMTWEDGAPDYGVDGLLQAVAAFPNVRLKFTTIPLGAIDKAGVPAAPILQRVIDMFGPERVLWGSDVAQSQGPYRYMTDLARAAAEPLGPIVRDRVLGETARAVYFPHV